MTDIRSLRRTYSVITVLFWLGVALPMPLFVLLMQARGMDLFQIGTLMGAYSLTIVLLEIPTGGLADALGRKRIGMVSYVFLLLAGLVYLFSFSFPAFLLASILNGIARALTSGTLDAWFIDSLREKDPEIDLQPHLAQIGTVTFLALGIGTLVGSLIPRWFSALPADGTAVLTPLATPMVFSLIPQIALIFTVAFFVKEHRSSDADTSWKAGFSQVPTILREAISLSSQNQIILLLIGASLVAGFVLASLETFWQPQFAALLDGDSENSFLFGVIMGGNFVVGMVGNQLSTRLGKIFKGRYGALSAVFQVLRGALLVMLALQSAAIPAMFLFWLVYLNMGIINSPLMTLFNNEIPSERRSSMLSIGSLVSYLGSIAGSTALGYVAERSSISFAWVISGIALILAAYFFVRIDTLLLRRRTLDDSKHAISEAS